MDINSIKQFTTKKSIFTESLFYISLSLIVASFLCYFIFSFRISSQKNFIEELDFEMSQIGSLEQKQREEKVFSYQKKIDDYSQIINNHKISSSVFGFIEKQTIQSVWFSKISLSEKENSINLSGEAENIEVLSRQIFIFENSEFVKKISILNSSLDDSGIVSFNLNLNLDPKIFDSL